MKVIRLGARAFQIVFFCKHLSQLYSKASKLKVVFILFSFSLNNIVYTNTQIVSLKTYTNNFKNILTYIKNIHELVSIANRSLRFVKEEGNSYSVVTYIL